MKIIAMNGVVGWDITSDDIEAQLKAAGGEEIRAEIHSPGGSVFEGLKIFNLFKNYAGEVNFHIMGIAASILSYIPMSKGKVTAEANTVFMIHNVWGFSGGDHRALRKSADIYEGLSKTLAAAYAKKCGSAMAEVRKMMDEETFFFGQEAVDAGFVDEIVGDDSGDKSAAVAQARLEVQECFARLKKEEQAEDSLDKIAALLVPSPMNSQVKPPSPAGDAVNKQQEEEVMPLNKLLQENQAARAKFDEALAAAKKDGGDAVQARITAVSPVLASAEYPAAVKAVALKVLAGENSTDALTAVVAMYDMQVEAAKAAQAKKESGEGGEAPPVAPNPANTDDGTLGDAAAVDAALKLAKGGA